MVCTVQVCVMWCCLAAFCRLGNSTHATPAATEQQEIIVLALDVFIDTSPLASLQTLLHASILNTINVLNAAFQSLLGLKISVRL